MNDSIERFLTEAKARLTGWYGYVRRQGVTRVLFVSIAGVFVFGLFFIFLVWIGIFGQIPSKKELLGVRHQQATEVYSADSVLLGRYYLQDRSMIPSSDIPQSLKQALIATEDVRFYKHHGVDTKSLIRVLIKGIILQRESAGGGSTLTQQLAKNLYPRRSYWMFSLPINKVREIIIARRLEKVYTKDDILVLYLNTIPFGDNVYGIKTAAERFFSVPVKDLTLEQSAVLVGMLKATHRYNPRIFPARGKERRDVVLGQLAKYSFISEQAKDSLRAIPLKLKYRKMSHNTGLAPYFRSYIRPQLLQWCRDHIKDDGSNYNLYTDGLKIYTTIDSRVQQYAEQAMRTKMEQLQKKFVNEIDKKSLQQVAMSKVTYLPRYTDLKKSGLSDKEIMAELKKPGLRKVFSWKGETEMEISVYDSLVRHLQFLQAGLLAVDPANGEIRAWVGGIDHEYFQFDHVRESTKRQVGSTFKPVVYAAAMEKGIGPCDYTSARKTSYTNMKDWAPSNSNDETYDQKFSMEGGLAGSVNTVSVKLLEKTGISNAIETAQKMGITSELPYVPSLALGTASISMMEMVGAYSVFANKGNYVEPFYITSITTGDGTVLETFKPSGESERAISAESAGMMLQMLKRVVNEGTGAGLRSTYGLTNDIGGKTGTTQSNTDGWFIGVTPKLVIGCWVGADDPSLHFRRTSSGQGATTALPIVALLLQKVNKDSDLRSISTARFAPLSSELMDRLDCDLARSDRNFFQRIFKKKKGTKATQYKEDKRKKIR
ncbi:MAG TPA: transglycosylase domain-containing protein [Chryseolinea sp.]|nr:transglycosylase domain-containing protein [Chryseolinea sp.]